MNEQQPHIYEVADGDVYVWVDGAIMLKTTNNPAELTEHEAITLAKILLRLAEEQGIKPD